MHLPTVVLPLLNLTSNEDWNAFSVPATTPCPLLGQIYPPPINITSSPIWKDAVTNINQALAALPAVQQNFSSFGIKIVSLHDSQPLFERFNRAVDHWYGSNIPIPLDGDAVFRIASVSKLFTVYTLLLKCGFKCFEDPITKYVPELAGSTAVDSVDDAAWDEVTVGALAAQLSGIGRDYSVGELGREPLIAPGTSFGLPKLDQADLPICGVGGFLSPCNREDSVKLMLQHQPTTPTWYTPAYSNMAFQLLGYVLQNITGQTYEEVLVETVFEPLGMKRSSSEFNKILWRMVLIPGDPTAILKFGDETPTGGIYASTNDLSTYALALLNHTQLSASQTRRWMKPHSHTSSPLLSFGAPWEIIRVPGSSRYHTTDIYTKSGSLGTYTTQFGIIPDLEVAYVVNALSALPAGSSVVFSDVVQSHILPPLYNIAKSQAMTRLCGTYHERRTGVNSSITIATDDEIGLAISEFISNGVDMLALLGQLGATPLPIRLFPTGLKSKVDNDNGTRIEKLTFRATIINPAGNGCLAPFLVDSLLWGKKALDLVIFETESEETVDNPQPAGRATTVHLPAFRARYDLVLERPSLQVQN